MKTIGEQMYDAVTARRIDGETVVAGCLHEIGLDRVTVEFYRYRAGKGIVGRVSMAEVAKLVPGIVSALRKNGDALKAYVRERREHEAAVAARCPQVSRRAWVEGHWVAPRGQVLPRPQDGSPEAPAVASFSV